MRAVLIAKQAGEGCDYTIECGTKVEYFEGIDRDNIIDKVEKYITDYGMDDLESEFALKTCELIFVGESIDFIPIFQKDAQEELEAKIESEKEAKNKKDLEEYERLKQKFGK